MKVTFELEIDDADPPPVSTETLHCEMANGGLRVLNTPFFISDLSYGDVILVLERNGEEVTRWSHLARSDHSTVWLLCTGAEAPTTFLKTLSNLGCRYEGMQQLRLYSIDVPPTVSGPEVDACLSDVPPGEFELAYPSWRHDDPDA